MLTVPLRRPPWRSSVPGMAGFGTRPLDRRAMTSLSLGHLASDLAQGAPPALLVFLKPKLGLSYTETAAVILAGTLSSSIIQPVFGLWSDRRGARWLLAAGVALGGIGIALAAISPNYPLLLLLVFLSGLGIGAFHPEGAKFAFFASGNRRATGMALFAIGGNAGFALGPLLVSGAVGAWGLEGGLLLAAPCLVTAAILTVEGRRLEATLAGAQAGQPAAAGEDQPGALALLVTIVAFRSVAYFGLFTFVPLWEVANGSSRAEGTRLLAYLLAAGAAGTVAAGPLADRFGRRPVIFVSFVLSVPLILVYVLAGGALGQAAAIASGAAIISTFGVTVVMSQEYLPSRVAMASGLSVGFSVGVGGVAAVALGAMADAIDLRTALIACAGGPALAALLTLVLPRPSRPQSTSPRPPSTDQDRA
jgi:FSR family fosmidomycin resistance protein-like MFS transporter